MNKNVYTLCSRIKGAGGMPYLVGGAVRDLVRGHALSDVDIEVFGLDADRLVEALSPYHVDQVGRAFGVYKVRLTDGQVVDVSLPRTERKSGSGHRAFDVAPSPDLPAEVAVQRRDFTMNALMQDVETGQIYDLVDGVRDIKRRVLRHVNAEKFGEDPLRVLRGMQFAARFNMIMDVTTADLCEGLLVEASTLPSERVWQEWEKWSRAVKPSRGLDVLDVTNWVLIYPALAALMITPQDKEWHPEGNVWQHTRLAVDEAALRASLDGLNAEDRSVLVFAALLHDIGKPATTVVHDDGRVTSPGHAEEGVLIADMFLRNIGAPDNLRSRVIGLVGEHMWGGEAEKITPRAVKRLARRLGQRGNSVLDLCRLMDTDRNARGDSAALGSPTAAVLMMEAERASVLTEGPVPILMGRHLLHLGFQPGRRMGNILKNAFERQLDGAFTNLDGALSWLRERNEYPDVDPS